MDRHRRRHHDDLSGHAAAYCQPHGARQLRGIVPNRLPTAIGSGIGKRQTERSLGEHDRIGEGDLRPDKVAGTALWDAVYFACRDKLAKSSDTVATRRAA